MLNPELNPDPAAEPTLTADKPVEVVEGWRSAKQKNSKHRTKNLERTKRKDHKWIVLEFYR